MKGSSTLMVAMLATALAWGGDSPAPAVPASTVGATAPATAPNKYPGWRSVVRDGKELFCKKQKATGSRLRDSESCYTVQQMEAREASVREFANDKMRAPVQNPL